MIQSLGEKLKLALITFVVLAVMALAITIIVQDRGRQERVSDGSEDGKEPMNKYEQSRYGTYHYAAVAADVEQCSTIGTKILGEKQGSAVDAVVASMFCLGVAHPHTSGIGGGFIMTIYGRDKIDTKYKMTSLISKETAPGKATENMYVGGDMSSMLGGSAIAVPGEVRGLYQAWLRFGSVKWAELVQPSIDLCETGSKVTSHMAHGIVSNATKDIINDTLLSDMLFNADGSPLQEGDMFRNPKLCKTLNRLASDPESFYKGSLAEEIIQDISDLGGIITMDDLRSYRAIWKDPVSVHLDNGNITVYGPPPPASAVVMQFVLNILDGYNLSAHDFRDTNSKVLTYHRLAESLKFAFGKHSLLGDADYVDVAEWISLLTNDYLANELRQRILDNMTQPVDFYDPKFDIVEDAGTTHISVLTSDGSAVSVTTSINTYFGSKRTGSRTGILFNNMMGDFSTPNTTSYFNLPASPANYIAPGKRPMSSMCPSIAVDKDGKVVLVLGGAGATHIISATAQVAMHNLWFGANIAEALDIPRIHHQLVPEILNYESTLSSDIQEGLKAKRHNLEEEEHFLGVCQAISTLCPDCDTDCKDGCIMAVSDYRKRGAPDGY